MSLQVEIVGLGVEPTALVRGLEGHSDEQIIAAVAEEWRAVVGQPPARWHVGTCQLWRWVPCSDYEYRRWLWPADVPGPGAFWAIEVQPGYL